MFQTENLYPEYVEKLIKTSATTTRPQYFPQDSFINWTQALNRKFSREEIKMAEKYLKNKSSSFLAISTSKHLPQSMKDSRTNAKEDAGEGTFPHLLADGIQIGPATLEISVESPQKAKSTMCPSYATPWPTPKGLSILVHR